MTRRCNGQRYLGNSRKKEVHDLDNEQTNPRTSTSAILEAV